MFNSEINIRVRYAETDRMGYVYYGNYATYFEVARVECLRTMGMTYKEMEDEGIILPVLEYYIRFIKPAFYDDLLTIKTVIKNMPGARITFEYETFNEKNILLNVANTTLVFINKNTLKPCPAPDYFKEHISKYFNV
ncbi:MAG TPA: thioesterase family protein [Bacteroidia bacterium]|nr:thioesterase family protein [Bacteroidia bacterium]